MIVCNSRTHSSCPHPRHICNNSRCERCQILILVDVSRKIRRRPPSRSIGDSPPGKPRAPGDGITSVTPHPNSAGGCCCHASLCLFSLVCTKVSEQSTKFVLARRGGTSGGRDCGVQLNGRSVHSVFRRPHRSWNGTDMVEIVDGISLQEVRWPSESLSSRDRLQASQDVVANTSETTAAIHGCLSDSSNGLAYVHQSVVAPQTAYPTVSALVAYCCNLFCPWWLSVRDCDGTCNKGPYTTYHQS